MNNDQNINFSKVLLWPQCFAALTATIGGLIWGTCIGKLPSKKVQFFSPKVF